MCELHPQLLELQQTGDSARVQCILRGQKVLNSMEDSSLSLDHVLGLMFSALGINEL